MAILTDPIGQRKKWGTPQEPIRNPQQPGAGMVKYSGKPVKTDVSQVQVPRQPALPTMPKFSGAPAGQGGFWSKVAEPFAKARTGMTVGLNKIMRDKMSQAPVESHANQLNRLVTTGEYTPEAEFSMYGLRQKTVPTLPGRVAYTPDTNEYLYPANYWDTNRSNPEAIQEDLRHEYGHFFDRGDKYSSNPEYLAAAKKTDAEFFPGMGLTNKANGNWGGPREMYADVGRNPYWFRKLSKFYPQYAAQAYNMPAFAGRPGNWTNENRTWPFMIPENLRGSRGPYTDAANRDPNKVISAPDQTPLYYSWQQGPQAIAQK